MSNWGRRGVYGSGPDSPTGRARGGLGGEKFRKMARKTDFRALNRENLPRQGRGGQKTGIRTPRRGVPTFDHEFLAVVGTALRAVRCLREPESQWVAKWGAGSAFAPFAAFAMKNRPFGARKGGFGARNRENRLKKRVLGRPPSLRAMVDKQIHANLPRGRRGGQKTGIRTPRRGVPTVRS